VSAGLKRVPAAALAACVLALAICPVGFIATGTLGMYPPTFGYVMVPPFVLGCGFLLGRYLARPGAPRRLPLLLLELPSWIAVLALLFFLSNYSLLTSFERVSGVCVAFLAALALCLPVALLRRTALEERLGGIPTGAALALVLVLIATTAVVAVVHLTTPDRFL
jgi:ABC-type amino acid transport substrate-binding protein